MLHGLSDALTRYLVVREAGGCRCKEVVVGLQRRNSVYLLGSATGVLVYYETSNNLLLFLLFSLQTPLGLNLRLKKTGLAWVFKSLILVYLVRPQRRPKKDSFNTKKRPNCD
jgi:hypothetical protein